MFFLLCLRECSSLHYYKQGLYQEQFNEFLHMFPSNLHLVYVSDDY